MATNPLVPQGTLNRLKGSILISAFPQLNITASFLGEQMIGLSFEGQATTVIPTATGTVQSPEPFQPISVTAHLLRTQSLAAQYEAQRVSSSLLGEFTVITDSTTMPNYTVRNGAIQNVRELQINGKDAGYIVLLTGYYVINNSLWGQ